MITHPVAYKRNAKRKRGKEKREKEKKRKEKERKGQGRTQRERERGKKGVLKARETARQQREHVHVKKKEQGTCQRILKRLKGQT